MVSVLIGNKNTIELDILRQKLTNDRNYRVENVSTGKDAISTYLHITPDILILDNTLSDMTIENIVDKLSINPLERKKCNIVLTLPRSYNIKMSNYSKINEVIYKPFVYDQFIDVLREISNDFNTPDLEINEIDWLLLSLNFNYFSSGYKYIKRAITYCYYEPDKLEYLNNILDLLAYEFNTTVAQVRYSMNASIKPFNNSCEYSCSDDLLKMLYNGGYKLSLKNFLERIVIYLIKTKKQGRLF